MYSIVHACLAVSSTPPPATPALTPTPTTLQTPLPTQLDAGWVTIRNVLSVHKDIAPLISAVHASRNVCHWFISFIFLQHWKLFGGAVASFRNATVSFSWCQFVQNEVYKGSACGVCVRVVAEPMFCSLCKGSRGGGIYAAEGSVTIDHCAFLDNTANVSS